MKKSYILALAITLVSTASYCVADTMTPSGSTTTTTNTKTNYYHNNRYDNSKEIDEKQIDESSSAYLKNNWDVSIFGGANLDQNADASFSDPGAAGSATTGLDSNGADHIGGVGGVKVGYDFNETALDLCGDFQLIPRLEFEAFYNNLDYASNFNGSDAGVRANIDSGVFSINPLAKITNGRWGFYAGPGIGATWLHTDKISNFSGGSLSGSDDDLALTVQGIAGVSYDINEKWKVFTEYKYVHLFDGDLGNGGGTLSLDNLGQHLVVAGIGYKF